MPSLFGDVITSFMNVPRALDPKASDAEVVVSGVPFDLACSGRAGTRMGPNAIRQATANLIWEGKRWPWNFALEERLKVCDAGNLDYAYGEPESLVDNLEGHAGRWLAAGKKMLTLGGDHYISLPLLRAHAREHGPLALIHFDAHTDTYEQGTRFDHGTIFHHALKEGLVVPEHSLQIGIRTSYERDNHPFEVLDADWVNDHGPKAVLEKIRAHVGHHPAYVSLDIDGLDPAFAPGTGTPVCGGMTTDLMLKVIRGLVGMELIGMDVVEVNPAYDHGDITSLAAATLGLEFLYVLAASKTHA
ncbi:MULTISPECIES: agmatinase [unclassified Halomonas]|uniref:agmatinase n=1 Tax=unclassified Halomonas TaxID=2609666 RepID=UPI0020769CCE|nr:MULTISPECIES: agmatinase [unclassified Halomonas]